MKISLQRLNDSPVVVRLVSVIGRLLPVWLGHPVADFVAGRLAVLRNSPMIRAVRANQWVARGETLGKEALDQAVRETLRCSARSIFDLYHYVLNPQATGRLIVLEPATQRLIQRPEFDRRGLVVVGLHLSNFDLVLQWMCTHGLRPLILTIPDPQGGRRAEYERRKKMGMNLLPASVGAIRQALDYLQRGGAVLTGIDRPTPEVDLRPRFFGRPAALPIHHIFLATKAQVPIVVMVTNLQSDGKYHVLTSDPIEMDAYADREEGMLRNAEKVLNIAENFIRQAPQQWSISLPVWPEALDLAP